jgi:phosphatidylglycerol:prolipoprotein diacylglycerol transferase
MRPILFDIADLHVWSHAVFAGLGMLVAIVVSWRIARREGRADRRMFVIIAGGMTLAAIFAQFSLVLRYLLDVDEPTVMGFLRFGGRTLLGGLVGGYLGIVLTKRYLRYTRPTGDVFAPGVALGMGIGRIGCFLAERPGTESTVAWAVRVPADAVPYVRQCPSCLTGAAMHPSFLYEAAFDVIAAIVLFRISRTRRLPAAWMVEGDVFKAFLFVYAVFRFFIEYVRGSPPMAFDMSGSQLTAMASSILLGLYLAHRWLSYRPENQLSVS